MMTCDVGLNPPSQTQKRFGYYGKASGPVMMKRVNAAALTVTISLLSFEHWATKKKTSFLTGGVRTSVGSNLTTFVTSFSYP